MVLRNATAVNASLEGWRIRRGCAHRLVLAHHPTTAGDATYAAWFTFPPTATRPGGLPADTRSGAPRCLEPLGPFSAVAASHEYKHTRRIGLRAFACPASPGLGIWMDDTKKRADPHGSARYSRARRPHARTARHCPLRSGSEEILEPLLELADDLVHARGRGRPRPFTGDGRLHHRRDGDPSGTELRQANDAAESR